MSNQVAAGRAMKRLNEVVASVLDIAEREEAIARNLRVKASTGGVPPEFVERARARADTLMRLATDLRIAVGVPVGRNW